MELAGSSSDSSSAVFSSSSYSSEVFVELEAGSLFVTLVVSVEMVSLAAEVAAGVAAGEAEADAGAVKLESRMEADFASILTISAVSSVCNFFVAVSSSLIWTPVAVLLA